MEISCKNLIFERKMFLLGENLLSRVSTESFNVHRISGLIVSLPDSRFES